MNVERFVALTERYPPLRLGVVGDFFLDRYLLIDPAKAETSIETGLPVYNVVEVRAQPGAAGTILNNLVALGVGEIRVVGYCGDDGEGYELRRALSAQPGVILENFLTVGSRRTPVYCKPLVVEAGQPPRELNRLDSKNWTKTPESLSRDLASRLFDVAGQVDALLLLDQVDLPETGVVTGLVREAAQAALRAHKVLVVLADSRRGLQEFPPLGFKMNAAELGRMTGARLFELDAVKACSAELARRNGQPVFVTLAERGIVGAVPDQTPVHVPAHPIRGPIDIVGAGDAVTANLAAALAAGASIREAMELAMAAASVVIHQLGTTGTASVAQIAELTAQAAPTAS
jgi:rfaE bifunctional protein kinase chain/domain